jgi:hypothetical protein
MREGKKEMKAVICSLIYLERIDVYSRYPLFGQENLNLIIEF